MKYAVEMVLCDMIQSFKKIGKGSLLQKFEGLRY
jgi:hypothetical protein